MLKKIIAQEKLCLAFFWFAYLFLCIYFTTERSTYADNSYYLFEIIQHKSFCIQYARYSAVLTQWLPLLAVKWNLSLNAIVFAYAINPVLLYFGIFIIIRYLTIEKWVSYIFLASLLITVHDSFFYVNDELNQAGGFLILMTAVLRSEKLNSISKAIGIFIVISILHFAHLFLVLAACVVLIIYFIEKRKKEAIIGLCFAILIILLRVTLLKGGRDGSSIDSLDWKFITLRNLHSSLFAVFFIKMMIQYYLPATLLLIILFIVNKIGIITQLFSIISFIAFYILLVVFLRNGASDVYNDKYLAILFLIFWSIIASFITDEKSNKPMVLIALLVAVIFSFVQLLKGNKYSERVNYLTKLMHNQPNKQIYLFEKVPGFMQTMSWSVPYEALFISSLQGETKTILIKESFYKIDDYLLDSTKFLGAEWTFPSATKLNERYFNLKNGLYELKN